MTLGGRSLQGWLERADALCRKGEYFEAHEELEQGWKAASGAEKVLLQGVIQLAAGLHRLRLHPDKPDGGLYLLERGLQKLAKHGALLEPDGKRRLEETLQPVIDLRRAPKTFALGLRTSA